MRRRLVASVFALAWPLALARSGVDLQRPAFAQEGHRAGVVVQFADGSIKTYCVPFAGESITGLDLLLKTGLNVQVESYGSIGAEVCKIGEDGCNYPDQPCACLSFGPGGVYWSYTHLKNDKWVSSSMGASSYKVHSGEVDGWAWSSGRGPGAAPAFSQLCAAAQPVPASSPTTATQPPTVVPPALPTVAPPAPTVTRRLPHTPLPPQPVNTKQPTTRVIAPTPTHEARPTPTRSKPPASATSILAPTRQTTPTAAVPPPASATPLVELSATFTGKVTPAGSTTGTPTSASTNTAVPVPENTATAMATLTSAPQIASHNQEAQADSVGLALVATTIVALGLWGAWRWARKRGRGGRSGVA